MKKLTAILIGCLLACDPTPINEDTQFRDLSEVLYLDSYDSEIGLSEFAEIVKLCNDIEKPELNLTFSAYDPGSKNFKVLGLGFSTMASEKLVDCYRQQMLDLGAHP